ncbi:6356_t:CDS:2 [Entrophospora sp. SA101]|nr:6356_t:CDS:2 [Entrophospora sp. SA101]
MTTFTFFILIALIFINVSSFYYTHASPIHHYKRGNNKTNKNNNNKFKPTANNDTSSQLPVSDNDVAEFRLWTKFANVPRDNNAYGNYYNDLNLYLWAKLKFVAINDKEKAIVVAFRGTANVKSFLNDLEFLQVPFFDKSNNAKIDLQQTYLTY